MSQTEYLPLHGCIIMGHLLEIYQLGTEIHIFNLEAKSTHFNFLARNLMQQDALNQYSAATYSSCRD